MPPLSSPKSKGFALKPYSRVRGVSGEVCVGEGARVGEDKTRVLQAYRKSQNEGVALCTAIHVMGFVTETIQLKEVKEQLHS